MLASLDDFPSPNPLLDSPYFHYTLNKHQTEAFLEENCFEASPLANRRRGAPC